MRADILEAAILPLGACACTGGYLASCVGAHVGGFPGMEPAGALAAAFAAWAHDRSGLLPLLPSGRTGPKARIGDAAH